MANNAPFYKMEPPGGEESIGKHGLKDLLATAGYISQDPLALTNPQGKRSNFVGVKKEAISGAPASNISSPRQNNQQDELSAVYPNTSSDGSIKFTFVQQPETQHRARYQTEGSRGAIKDRSGSGFPTVRLDGYNLPVKVQIFIGNDNGKVSPHMFYQACRVTGKNSYPCDERKVNGTDVIEVTVDCATEKLLVCDCVGILKERFADVEARFPKHKNWKTTKKKSTKCRLIFRVRINNSKGQEEILQVASSVINCTQLPGLPEIQRMSTTTSPVKGGGELWIIGKNFLKETVVVFSYTVKSKKEPIWSETCKPDKDYLHHVHLITKIPPFVHQDITSDVEVLVYIKCGDKQSDPHSFTYTASACSSSSSSSSNHQEASRIPVELPKKVSVAAPAAVAINENYTKTRAITLLPTSTNSSSHSSSNSSSKGETAVNGSSKGEAAARGSASFSGLVLRPVDSLHHNHKNKKRCLDYQGKGLNFRRTRSVPRPKTLSGPSLLNEDTVFVSGGNIPEGKFPVTSFSNVVSPWKNAAFKPSSAMHQSFDTPTTFSDILSSTNSGGAPSPHVGASQPLLGEQAEANTKPAFTLFAKRSFSNDEDDSHHYTTASSFPEENSTMCGESSSAKSDFSSNLTTDFSNVFTMIREKSLNSGGASLNHTIADNQGGVSSVHVPSHPGMSTGHAASKPASQSGTPRTSLDGYSNFVVLSPPDTASPVDHQAVKSQHLKTESPLPALQPCLAAPTRLTSVSMSEFYPGVITLGNQTKLSTPDTQSQVASLGFQISAATPGHQTGMQLPNQQTSLAATGFQTGVNTVVGQQITIPSSGTDLTNFENSLVWKKKSSNQFKENTQESSQSIESGSTSFSSGAGVSFNTNNEDKATISISLPTSILKDQKHFQSVIETINNVLIHSPDESTVAPTDVVADGSSANMSSHMNVSPTGKVTSVPVSVLTSKANRKRNFSNEEEPYGVETIAQTTPSQGEHKGEGVVQSSMDWEANNKKAIHATDNSMDWSSNTAVQTATPQEPWESSINLQPWGGSEKKQSSHKEVSDSLKPVYSSETSTFPINNKQHLQYSVEDQANDSTQTISNNPSSVQQSDKVFTINESTSTLGGDSDVYMTQQTEKVYVIGSGTVAADLSQALDQKNHTTTVSFQDVLPSQSSGEVFIPVTQVASTTFNVAIQPEGSKFNTLNDAPISSFSSLNQPAVSSFSAWEKSTVPALSSSDQSDVYNSLSNAPTESTYRAPSQTVVSESSMDQQSFNQESVSVFNNAIQESLTNFRTPNQHVISEFNNVAAPNQPVTVFSVQHQASSCLPVSSGTSISYTNSMPSVVKSTGSVMFSEPITSSTNLLNSQTVLTSLPSNDLTVNGPLPVYMIPATSTVSSIVQPIASEFECRTLQQLPLDSTNQYAIVTTSSSNPFQSQSDTSSFVLSQPSAANTTPTNIFAESTTYTNPFQDSTASNVKSSAESNNTQQVGSIFTQPLATPIGSFNENSVVHSSSNTSQSMSYGSSSTLQSDISANLFTGLPVVTGSQSSNESTQKVFGAFLNDLTKPANTALLQLNDNSFKSSDQNIEFGSSDNSKMVRSVPFGESHSATVVDIQDSSSAANTFGNEPYLNEMVSDATNITSPYVSVAATSPSLTTPYTLDAAGLSSLTSPFTSQAATPVSLASPYDSAVTPASMTSPYASAVATSTSLTSPYTSTATPEAIVSPYASDTPTQSSLTSLYSSAVSTSSLASPYASNGTPEALASPYASATPNPSSVGSAYTLETTTPASYTGGETHQQQDISSVSVHLPSIPSNKSLSSMDYEMSNATGGLIQEQSEYQKVNNSDMAMYDDAISPIQGDPLLSETSSVIEAQKDIEIASAAASSNEAGSDVMNMVGQTWKTTSDPTTDSISQWGQ